MRRVLSKSFWTAVALADRFGRSRIRVVPVHRLHTLPETNHLTRFFEHFDVDCVFDVGANRGQYARMLRSEVGYKGNIISFEPIPVCAQAIRAASAGDPLWTVEQVALSDRSGTVSFNVMEDDEFSSLSSPDTSGFTDVKEANTVRATISVRTEMLSDVVARYAQSLGFRRPFLKMDTQGNDRVVAEGAGASLHVFVGLQSELAVIPLYEGATTYRDMLAFYESKGFRLSAFVPNNAGHFPTLVETDCIMFNEHFQPSAGNGR